MEWAARRSNCQACSKRDKEMVLGLSLWLAMKVCRVCSDRRPFQMLHDRVDYVLQGQDAAFEACGISRYLWIY